MLCRTPTLSQRKSRATHLKCMEALPWRQQVLFCNGSWSSHPDQTTDENNPARAIQNRGHIHGQFIKGGLMVIHNIDGFPSPVSETIIPPPTQRCRLR